jgi:DNA-binding GntR family transcriptional regulator
VELEFHSTIWEAAQNELLLRQLNQTVVITLSLNTVHYFKPRYDLEELLKSVRGREKNHLVDGHQLLSQSILDRDPQAARKNMILHIMGDTHEEMRRQFFQI